MQDTWKDRLAHAWNVFRNKEPTDYSYRGGGYTYGGSRPDRGIFISDKDIVNSIYNRIALDVASLDYKHILLDKNDNYKDDIKSSLNDLFNVEANIDQAGTAFTQDIVHSMLDEGIVAVVPVETKMNPNIYGGLDITQARVGRITSWYEKEVRVEVFNQQTQIAQEVTVSKKFTPIITNPLYEIMNEPNSNLKRLKEKLRLLDIVDNRTSSGKLDMIIQLPYTVKTKTKQNQAEERKKLIEDQMVNSKYGIAYIDAAERITQLNRPVASDLVPQVEYLTKMVYNELGLTSGIFDGTAEEKEVLNYFNRTIEPIAKALVEEVRRKWLTKTARTQGQWFDYFRDMFKLIPISQLAELADKLTRNEIMSSNDMRSKIGMKPHPSKRANDLVNKNINPNGPNEKIKMEDETNKEGDTQ